MNEAHPINPPPELVQQWMHDRQLLDPTPFAHYYLASRAAQWGADRELEACCDFFRADLLSDGTIERLRTARRPKPPSTIEIAEEMIARHNDGWTPSPGDWVIIRDALADGRRAQEALSSD